MTTRYLLERSHEFEWYEHVLRHAARLEVVPSVAVISVARVEAWLIRQCEQNMNWSVELNTTEYMLVQAAEHTWPMRLVKNHTVADFDRRWEEFWRELCKWLEPAKLFAALADMGRNRR